MKSLKPLRRNASLLPTFRKKLRKTKASVPKEKLVKGVAPSSSNSDLDTLLKPGAAEKGSQKKTSELIRRKSYECLDVVNGKAMNPKVKSRTQKMLKAYMPRRRFSQGAIQPIRDMLQQIEDEEKQKKHANKDKNQLGARKDDKEDKANVKLR